MWSHLLGCKNLKTNSWIVTQILYECFQSCLNHLSPFFADWACGLWQFSSHSPPIFYASFLIAIVYHAFITLFLDYSGGYEDKAKRMFFVILLVIITLCTIISAPSGFFGTAKTKFHGNELSHFRQHCDLTVPGLMISQDKMTEDMHTDSEAAYRLVYELILPFILPIVLLGM